MHYETAEDHLPGDVVLAKVMNPLENANNTGKFRPVVLIQRVGGHWRVMGLTTNDAFADGRKRTPVPNWQAVGLHGPGYLWGDRLTNVSVLDVGRRVGEADLELAVTIVRAVPTLTRAELWALLATVLDLAA